MALTREAAAAGARLVVWPESAVPFYYDHTPAAAVRLQDLARQQGIALLFGNDDLEAAGPGGRVWVGAKLLTSQGELAFRYHKIRLVPFGEYVPMKPLLTLGGRFAARLVRQVADFAPGQEFSLGRVDGHTFGAFICYEAIFPDLVRQFSSRGAELLVNITNDGWYGRTSAPHQHFAMAVFRAVENGRTLLRAANTGISAIVDPRGRVLARTALFERCATVGDAPIVGGATFYARYGDVFAWACFVAAAVLSVASLGSGRMQHSEA
jgi:apolipoprotein N-acyltransferase